MKHSKTIRNYPGSHRQLSEEMGDLFYDSLAELLKLLAEKISRDSSSDRALSRLKLASELSAAAVDLHGASEHVSAAWQICEPYVRAWGNNDEATATPRPLVIFSHGKESGPNGQKIAALVYIAREYGADVIVPNYREITTDPTTGLSIPPQIIDQDAPGESERRVAFLLNEICRNLASYCQLILVGSSMGSYVSTVASSVLKPDGLFLLAPAFYMPGYQEQDPVPHAGLTWVVHGYQDETIPVENSIRFARQHDITLHLLPGDHRL